MVEILAGIWAAIGLLITANFISENPLLERVQARKNRWQ